MFGHNAMMFRRGCYIDGGPVNGAGGDVAAPTDIVDDSALFEDNDEPEAPVEEEPEAKPDTPKEGETETAEQSKERTSKQPPEVDAAFARARKAEERAAQLERELVAKQTEEARRQAEKATADNQAALDQEWNSVLQKAEQLKAAGYDEHYVGEFIENNRARIITREELKTLRQEREQERQRSEQANRQRETDYAVKSFFGEMGELRKQYGDLIPDTAGIKDDLSGFFEYSKLLPEEMMAKIARGYSPTDAFVAVSYSKITSHEKSKAQKRTVANISDRMKRGGGISSDSEGASSGVDIPVNNEMAEAFGNDPKEIAKYVKQQIKTRR